MGGIKIFFFVPLLWDPALSSFRDKDFANFDISISSSHLPREPFTQDDRLLHLKTPKITLSKDYTLINSREPTCSSPLQSPSTDKSVWIIASTSRSGNHNSLVL